MLIELNDVHGHKEGPLSIVFVKLAMEGSRDIVWVVFFPKSPNIMYSFCIKMMIGMIHIWWRCLCVTFMKDVASSTLLYALY